MGRLLAMGWFWSSNSQRDWSLTGVEPPWHGRRSIYAELHTLLAAGPLDT